MLAAAKSSLAILAKSFKLKHNLENIQRKDVNQIITDNSRSNISKLLSKVFDPYAAGG